jgi:basic membrane protein A
MSIRRLSLVIVVVFVLAVALSACGTAEEEKPLFCLVTDVGGIMDKSLSQTAWKGVQDAMAENDIEGKYLESKGAADYEVNINAFLEEDCDIIFPVGYMLADAAFAAAEANPDQHFSLIDIPSGFDNMRGSLYKIQETTFLNGYLAAGMTETGIVATYTGILFPATQEFMDGFAMGIAHYNEVHGTDVQLLGWDMETQQGLEAGNFESSDDGRRLGESLMDEGADIIMPVAGPVGAGTLALMAERETGMLIGVDNDWAIGYPEWSDYVLSNALKNMDYFVQFTIEDELNGEFTGGDFIGTLDNGGVGISYGPAFEDKIPDDLKAEIDALTTKIIAGEIAVLPVRE